MGKGPKEGVTGRKGLISGSWEKFAPQQTEKEGGCSRSNTKKKSEIAAKQGFACTGTLPKNLGMHKGIYLAPAAPLIHYFISNDPIGVFLLTTSPYVTGA